jgi:hypothetical protein
MADPTKPSPFVDIQMSHGRLRTELRRPTDGGTPPLPPPENTVLAVPIQDAKTGKFIKGNQAARRRRLKEKADNLQTLNPAKCESWLQPYATASVKHGLDLIDRFSDPILAPLAGATADALSFFRGFAALAAAGDIVAVGHARAWLKEYRGCVRELCALAALQLEQDKKEQLENSFLALASEEDFTRDDPNPQGSLRTDDSDPPSEG